MTHLNIFNQNTQGKILRVQIRQPELQKMLTEIQKAVNGKNDVIFKVLLTILAGGHILLEDMPGVGKTTLALAISRTMELSCKRIQFTPDVLPTDVTGFTMYQKNNDKFVFRKGAAFCNLLLADEINRTSSKTQSALLELMEEGAVTIDGMTYPLPNPHIVIATQNPITCVGTQKLPESQMDRFFVRLSLGYPSPEHEIALLKARQGTDPLDDVESSADTETLLEMRREVNHVYVSDMIYQYIVDLVQATRNHPDIRLGISPRGSLALMQMAKSCAWAQGRDYLLPDDVSFICADVFCHRLLLHGTDGSPERSRKIVKEILSAVPVPESE
ncbi:MAG: MoxR family ATPase [Oscillospiraceae bacterium]|nr:MoxR family ATPase [Oscillospiraceae bacterium]MDE5885573.1 MoxR family ATPase [Oscillospiraceae bacterium]